MEKSTERKGNRLAHGKIFFSLLPVIALVGLFSQELQGEVKSKRLLLFHFDKIEVRGAASVFIEPGKRNREIEYFADSSIIEDIHVEVRNRTLHIDANNTLSLSRRIPLIRFSAQRVFPVEVIVSAIQVDEILLLDQSNLTAQSLSGERLKLFSNSTGTLQTINCKHKNIEIRQEGSGNIILKGRNTLDLEAKVYGSGSLEGGELFIDRAKVSHWGSGQVLLAPTKWLDLKLHGSGNFHLLEKPAGMVVDQGNAGGRMVPLYEGNPQD